jgi:hypothetical protein
MPRRILDMLPKEKRNVPRIGLSLTLALYWKYSPFAIGVPYFCSRSPGQVGQENCACYTDIAVGRKEGG